MDPSWTELAPLSALGHSNIKMQVSGSARTSPFICFGAHQYPNSNMSNLLTQYLTLLGTLLHNTFSDSTARSRMGSEKQKGGGGGATSSGANTASVPQLWYFCKGGQGQKIFFLRFFFRNPFLRRAQSQKLIFFAFFFCGKTTRWTGNLLFLQIVRIGTVLPSSAAVCRKSPTAHCSIVAPHTRSALRSMVVHTRNSRVQWDFHYPLPKDNEAVNRRGATARSLRAVSHCTEGVTGPTAPRQ